MTNRAISLVLSCLFVSCGGTVKDNGDSTPTPTPTEVPTAYSIGGTVSGLSGGELVLRNSGGDDLSIVSNGPFTFDTKLRSGLTYNVTVSTHPVGQMCSVTEGSGSVGAEDVVSISVTCSEQQCSPCRWTHPKLSESISPNGTNAYFPRVAMDGNGDAIVVWKQWDGSTDQIFMSEYRDGSWTHPRDVDDKINPEGLNANGPQVAMGNNGDAIVVWRQRPNAISWYRIFKSEYRDGEWTHPTGSSDSISPNGTDVFEPQVAMGGNGEAIVVWQMRDASGKLQVFKSEYRDGSWTHPGNTADNISPNGQHAYGPQVAMDVNGDAIVVWYQTDDSGSVQIFMSERRGGVWTHPGSLADSISPNGQHAHEPQVAMGENGDAIVVWYQSDGSKDQIFVSEYRDGEWAHPEGPADNISPPGTDVSNPQVDIDGHGDAIVVWDQRDSSDILQIFKSECRDGDWIHPTNLDDNISPHGTHVTEAQVAMGENGDAIVVWWQPDGFGNVQIFMSEHRDGEWTHPEGLNDSISPAGTGARKPQVDMDGNGEAVVVWYQSDGSTDQIFKSEYRCIDCAHP